MNKAVSGNKVTQDPPIEVDLNLQLEELYTGCLKKIKISRKVRCIFVSYFHYSHVCLMRCTHDY